MDMSAGLVIGPQEGEGNPEIRKVCLFSFIIIPRRVQLE